MSVLGRQSLSFYRFISRGLRFYNATAKCELHNANLGDWFLLAARFSGTISDSDVGRAGARLGRRTGEGRDELQVWMVKLEDFEVLNSDELPA